MIKSHVEIIASEGDLKTWQVENVMKLLDEGATIPFISRYRKESTGSLDEVSISRIRDRSGQLREIDKRRDYILKSVSEQEKLTPDLEKAIKMAETMAVLEDLYLPYKPKRRTKATIAREKGLEPLAKLLFEQKEIPVEAVALKYVNPEKEVNNAGDALQGTREIIAEWISEDAYVREKLRERFMNQGIMVSKVIRGKETEGQKYKDYFEFQEKISKIPSHRMLALRRGEKELILSLDIQPDEESAIGDIENCILVNNNEATQQVSLAIKDAYKRLLKPSMETEVRMKTKKTADTEAISVFADNLRQLLLAPPLGQKRLLALDPGFRTGCKLVCLNEQGKLMYHTTIFPHEPQQKVLESSQTLLHLVNEYRIEAIAIGNGTASRETERFVRSVGLPSAVTIVMVNESGASVYSASGVAREEFPDQDVTVRGAVSIGRRLMDPLAELVKIDPKSIGVGQYQHDVDQTDLKHSLDDVVISCVNAVGVELNTASRELLSYVSGLGPQLAGNIIDYRNNFGAFRSREDLKKVTRMGEKAFEQSAGFLRIYNAENPLDASAVHPERYQLVDKMARDLETTVQELIASAEKRNNIDIKKYVSEEVGIPTLNDIIDELNKPGRDPREAFEVFAFSDDVKEISDLQPGMVLPGIVTNITKFGAFIDIGVHQDGLVHISQMADRFVSDPAEVVKIHQKVTVSVVEVDAERRRISLSMKSREPQPSKTSGIEKRQQTQTPEVDYQTKLSALKGKFRSKEDF